MEKRKLVAKFYAWKRLRYLRYVGNYCTLNRPERFGGFLTFASGHSQLCVGLSTGGVVVGMFFALQIYFG